MYDFQHILDWKLTAGTHEFPGPDGGTCINEAAIVAAGFPYKPVEHVSSMPPCFSRILSQFALVLNDNMPDDQRQRLIPYVTRLAGTADARQVERARAEHFAMQAVTVVLARALDAYGAYEQAHMCRAVKTLHEADLVVTNLLTWGILPNLTRRVGLAVTNVLIGSSLSATVDVAMAMVMAAGTGVCGPSRLGVLAGVWDDALAAFDGALAIGKQAEPVDQVLLIGRLANAKNLGASRVSEALV